MSGSVNYSSSANGWDVTIYWECEYGDTNAYMYWVVNRNSYGRVFQVVSKSNTSNRYNNYSNVPFGDYLLYVYRNGSYSQQEGPFKIAAPQPTYYTITYDANGGDGSTESQSVISGSSVNLRSNGFTPPTEAVHGITLRDSDGTTLSSSTYSTFKNNAFYRWIINSQYYAAGATYKPTADVTAKASWSTNYTLKKVTKSPTTTTGFTITYNPNGGTCSKTSETMINTTTYDHTKWVTSGGSEYNPTVTIGGPASYTFTVKYTTTTIKGSTILPTPINEATSTLKITFDYQGGSGSSASANSTRTIIKAFNGWATSSTATTGVTGSYEPDESRTLYAIWGATTIEYSAINLPTPTRIGYKFMGWATSATASTGVTGTYTPTSDSITTLYAIWKADGSIRLYINDIDKYKIAMVWMYYPTSSTDLKPWKLVIPYMKTSSNWKITAG